MTCTVEASNFGIWKGRLSPSGAVVCIFSSKYAWILFENSDNLLCYFATKIDIAGSASQLNCFENWKTFAQTLFVFCLPGFKHRPVYKFLNLTFLWWETMKNALFYFYQFAKLIQFLILQQGILLIERLYKQFQDIQ